MSPSPTTSAHAATNDDTLQRSAESTKSLKRKSKKAKEDEREENRREQLQGRSDTAVTEQVQTKHNDVNTLQEHMSVMDTTVKKRKKDKSKGSQPEERPTNPSLDLGELGNSKSHRKTKKRKSTAEAEADGSPDLNDEKPKTKKRKKSTEFTDPNDDESISDQSKKGEANHIYTLIQQSNLLTTNSYTALAYVFSQSVKPKTWKFNKARQNWLIRNLWSPEAVRSMRSFAVMGSH